MTIARTLADLPVYVSSTIGGITITGNIGIGTSSPVAPLEIISNSNAYSTRIRGRSTDNISIIQFTTFNASTELASIRVDTTSNVSIITSGIERLRVTPTGNIQLSGNTVPNATNTYDLGSAVARWKNIYTQDLHLSNGIGDWTVVEGEENLYIVNNKNGKNYKFALVEVDAQDVPPKSI
jgi:hypothetical protein